jgi:hypothetical protein
MRPAAVAAGMVTKSNRNWCCIVKTALAEHRVSGINVVVEVEPGDR